MKTTIISVMDSGLNCSINDVKWFLYKMNLMSNDTRNIATATSMKTSIIRVTNP